MKRNYITYGMLIALSVVLSFIVIPSIAGTVALDSTPAYIASIYFGPIVGGIIGAVAHLLSAFIKGFPMGIPAHLIVAATMIVAVFVFGYIYRKGHRIVAIIVGTFMNGVVSPLPFMFIIGKEFYIALLIPLTFASLVNILLSVIVFEKIKGYRHE